MTSRHYDVDGVVAQECTRTRFQELQGTKIDILVVGNHLLKKEDQDEALKIDYKNVLELD